MSLLAQRLQAGLAGWRLYVPHRRPGQRRPVGGAARALYSDELVKIGGQTLTANLVTMAPS